MQVILKHNPAKCFYPFFMADAEKKSCCHLGYITPEGMEAMLEKGILEEVDHTELIEKYSFSSVLINNASKNKYYSLGS